MCVSHLLSVCKVNTKEKQMSNDKSQEQRIDILVYEVSRPDGIREIRLFPEEQAEKDGGAAAIESGLQRKCNVVLSAREDHGALR